MPSVSSEIIAEITAHMSKFGGDFSAWCIGTAHGSTSPGQANPPTIRKSSRSTARFGKNT